MSDLRLLNRCPKGRWISQFSALAAWLPTLLGASWSSQLEIMLETAAKWCNGKAAEEYANAAKSLADESVTGKPYAFHCARRAEKWIAKRDLLMDTARRIREVDHAA